jgi:lauroyl/myristoyl acyltransferase
MVTSRAGGTRITRAEHDAGIARLPLVSLPDLHAAAVLVLGYLGASLLPRACDARIAGALAALWLRVHPGAVQRLAAAIQARLGDRAGRGRELEAIAREHFRTRVETGWGRIRGMRRGGWTPAVALEGREHVARGLAGGRGVILWRFALGSGPALMHAFADAGWRPVHLSRAEHGSRRLSRFGLRTVCSMWQVAENRWLCERIVIPTDASLGYVRVLADRLQANAVVSIAGEHGGRGALDVTVLGSSRKLATGAAALAWETGATLVTCCSLREAPQRYRVVVDPPIELERGAGRREAVRCAVEEYARRLEARIREHPADWRGWGTRLI